MDYLPLLIAVGTNDPSNTRYKVYDTMADFGCYVKHVPFDLFPEVKNIHTQTWNDEDGDDEYMPLKPRYKSYEMDIEFVYKGNYGDANQDILNFIQTIQGKWLKIYDTYSQIGRQMVRYVSMDEKATLYRRNGVNDKGGRDLVVFKLKFKVNDPITNIIL